MKTEKVDIKVTDGLLLDVRSKKMKYTFVKFSSCSAFETLPVSWESPTQ